MTGCLLVEILLTFILTVPVTRIKLESHSLLGFCFLPYVVSSRFYLIVPLDDD